MIAHKVTPLAAAAEFLSVRALSLRIAEGMTAEDAQMQSMPDASPMKWHLAHTTWFFETFVLARHAPGYCVFHAAYADLFNSYYNAVGAQFPRAMRGTLSRPSLAEVRHWRMHVENGIESLLAADNLTEEAAFMLQLGLQHEQQHQELMLTDIKHALFQNPLRPAYRYTQTRLAPSAPQRWYGYEGGLSEMGSDHAGFSFDHEGPRHRVFLQPFEFAARLVSNGEYAEFIEAGGYAAPEFWLADAWAELQAECRRAPLYWHKIEDRWWHYTHSGDQPIDPEAPVAYLSYYEADAYAHWAGARLPSEAEWEHAAQHANLAKAHLLDLDILSPRAATAEESGPLQMFGDAWEWTRSAYAPHPGFRPFQGLAAEYNGKFMSGQMVLKGGSCLTPPGHMRAGYRNFFSPDARWQCSGIRLARDVA